MSGEREPRLLIFKNLFEINFIALIKIQFVIVLKLNNKVNDFRVL